MAAASPSRLATDAVGPLGRALPPAELGSGRATSVPFTAVLAGPERTLTDKTTAATTCGDHHIRS